MPPERSGRRRQRRGEQPLDGPLAPFQCASRTRYVPCEDCDVATCQVRHMMLDVRNAIADGAMDPMAVAAKIKTFTPDTQLARVYRLHHEIQRGDISAQGRPLHSVTG